MSLPLPSAVPECRQGHGQCMWSYGSQGNRSLPQHGCFHPAQSLTLQQIHSILASLLSPSGGGRARGAGGIHPKWASISFLSLWALCQAELQAVTLQTVINHKLWAVLKCLPRNLLVHRKSEMLLIGFQQLSPFLAQIYLIWHSDNAVDYSPGHPLDPSK